MSTNAATKVPLVLAPAEPVLSKRLDGLMRLGAVRMGTRFLYTLGGAARGGGKLFEGTLHEISASGHVRLNASGCWDWPAELFVEEILSGAGKEDGPPAAGPEARTPAGPPDPKPSPKTEPDPIAEADTRRAGAPRSWGRKPK